MMEGVRSVALCRADCSSPDSWRLVEIEFKGFMVPRFRLLPAVAHGKCTQKTIQWWSVLSPWDMVCLGKTVFPSAKLTKTELVIYGRWLIHCSSNIGHGSKPVHIIIWLVSIIWWVELSSPVTDSVFLGEQGQTCWYPSSNTISNSVNLTGMGFVEYSTVVTYIGLSFGLHGHP